MAFSFVQIPRTETTFTYQSPEGIAFANLTEPFSQAVSASGVKEGIALIESRGFGLSLLVQEAGQQVEQDILAWLRTYAAKNDGHILFHSYEALPIIDGKLKLGLYQSILAMMISNEQVPTFSVTPVHGRLETITIDTGKNDYPVLHESNSDYASKGGKKILNITDEISRAIARLGNKAGDGDIALITGNTTAGLFCETKEKTINGLVKDIDRLYVPDFHYRHNVWALRHDIPPDERMNGFSHIACAKLLKTSVLLPPTGPEGRVCLADMDAPRDNRVLYVAVAEPR